MDKVIVSCADEDRSVWAQVLKGTGIHGEVTHQLSCEIGAFGVVHRDDVGVSALKVSAQQLGMRARAAERIFDLASTGGELLILSPIMLITAYSSSWRTADLSSSFSAAWGAVTSSSTY